MSHFCQKLFLVVNMVFSMFAGGLLVTAARLFFDPFTFKLFEAFFPVQLEVLRWYNLLAGLYIAALVFIAVSAVYPRSITLLNVYLGGMIVLILSEVACMAWLVKYTMDYSMQLSSTASSTSNPDFKFKINLYIIVAALIVSILLQATALVSSCVLQMNRYAQKNNVNGRSSDRGWNASNEYRYYANGAGTSNPETSTAHAGHGLASAPPPYPTMVTNNY